MSECVLLGVCCMNSCTYTHTHRDATEKYPITGERTQPPAPIRVTHQATTPTSPHPRGSHRMGKKKHQSLWIHCAAAILNPQQNFIYFKTVFSVLSLSRLPHIVSGTLSHSIFCGACVCVLQWQTPAQYHFVLWDLEIYSKPRADAASIHAVTGSSVFRP